MLSIDGPSPSLPEPYRAVRMYALEQAYYKQTIKTLLLLSLIYQQHNPKHIDSEVTVLNGTYSQKVAIGLQPKCQMAPPCLQDTLLDGEFH